MSVIGTENARIGGLVKWEQGGSQYFSRKIVTIPTGQVVKVGTVLGQVTAGGKYIPSDGETPATDGSEVAAAISLVDLGTTTGDTQAVVLVRDAIVSDAALVWLSSYTATEIGVAVAELEALGILVRTGQPGFTYKI